MPQMAPINWLSLFFMFILTFIMFNILNYFSMKTNNFKYLSKCSNNKSNSMNWKW